jgi:predicted flap endonuclease-1-like 5' DNA nuclease
MAYRLTDLSIVTDRIAEVLKDAGIHDTNEFLMAAAAPAGIEKLAKATGLDTRLLSEIAERVDIMRVRGIGPAYAELLEHAGIRSLPDMAKETPESLQAKLAKAAETYGVARVPRDDEVEAWIASASEDVDAVTWRKNIRTQEVIALFDEDEWGKIRRAPIAVAALVMTASTSWGKDWVAEGEAAAHVVAEAKQGTLPYSLINVAYPTGFDLGDLQTFVDMHPRATMLSDVKDAMDIVKAKAPTAADSYRALLMEVGESVAAAAKEGGFLGMGKKLISKDEQETLDDIKATIS